MSKSILQDEKWKDVQGYEGMYQVSNHGRVKSLGQRVAYKSRWGTVAYRDYPAKIMHPTDNGNGYLIVSFRKNGHRKNYYIHRLVAEAFIGTIGDLEINHIDYNTKNNAVANLEIVSRKENVNHSVSNMRKPRKHHRQSKTGEKYIYFANWSTPQKPRYNVKMLQFGISKSFTDFESAINFRDQVINNEQEYFAR